MNAPKELKRSNEIEMKKEVQNNECRRTEESVTV